MKTTNRAFKKFRGSTLVEVMVASSLMLIVFTIVLAIWSNVRRSFNFVAAQVEARQEVRKVTDIIASDIRNAAYIFSSRTATINGVNYQVPAISYEDTPPYPEGQSIIMAIPQDADVTSMKYSIVGYYLTSTPTDVINPNTRDLMRYEVKDIVPQVANMPSSIDLNSSQLSDGFTKKVAGFIEKTGFKVRIWNNGNAVEVKPLAIKKQRSNMPEASAQVILKANIRNQ